MKVVQTILYIILPLFTVRFQNMDKITRVDEKPRAHNIGEYGQNLSAKFIKNLHIKEFSWCPPMARIEDQNIRINPPMINIIHLVQIECQANPPWSMLWWQTLLH